MFVCWQLEFYVGDFFSETLTGPRKSTTRLAPTSDKWSYDPYKRPYKWVTGVTTLLIEKYPPQL